jgi:hypothetical protein
MIHGAKNAIGGHAYRIRVWRAKEMSSVVLASQVVGSTPPNWMTNQIAWYALSAILKHDEEGMTYFEDEKALASDNRILTIVHFDYFGHDLRRRPYKPSPSFCEWSTLETVVGEAVDR